MTRIYNITGVQRLSGSTSFAVPTLTSISPTNADEGTTDLTCTLTGTNFEPETVVRVDGNSRATTYISSTSISFTVTTADMASDGTLSITAFTPAPGGGETSAQTFTVNAGATVFWDSGTHNANITLSNGDLTVNRTGDTSSWDSVLCNTSISGKKYWEITLDQSDNETYFMIGCATSSLADTSYPGQDADGSVGCQSVSTTTRRYISGSFSAYGVDADISDVLMVAYDDDNDEFYYGINGTWNNSADPVAGTGGISLGTGTYYPAAGLFWTTGSATVIITANFGATAFAYTPPSGYSALEP